MNLLIPATFESFRLYTEDLKRDVASDDWVIFCLEPEVLILAESLGYSTVDAYQYMTELDHRSGLHYVSRFKKSWIECAPEAVSLRIGSLKLTDIFEYEFDTTFSDIIYRLISTVNALNFHKPKRIRVICHPLGKGGASIYHLYNAMASWYSQSYPETEFVPLSQARRPIIDRVAKNIRRFADAEYRTIINYAVRNPRDFVVSLRTHVCGSPWSSEGIVINASHSKTDGVRNYFRSGHKVCILRSTTWMAVMRRRWHYKSIHQEWLFDQGSQFEAAGIDITNAIISIASDLLQQFQTLERLFWGISEEVLKAKPSLYMTIYQNSSVDKTIIHAMHSAGVRTVWLSEGLNYAHGGLWEAHEACRWHRSDHEKWLFSKAAADEYILAGANPSTLRVTGYLPERFRSEDVKSSQFYERKIKNILPNSQPLKIVCFATTALTLDETTQRLLVTETSLEAYRSIQSVVTTVTQLDNIILLIKPHNKQSLRIADFLSAEHESALTVDIPVDILIKYSDVIIVRDSSVGLEALFRGKHVISHSLFPRPHSLTPVAKDLDKWPHEMPKLYTSTSSASLRSSVLDALANEVPEGRRNARLSYHLENAATDYVMDEKIYSALLGPHIKRDKYNAN